MLKIKSLAEAEIGDFIIHKGKIHIISSVQEKGDYALIGLAEGEVIVLSKNQKSEIFRVVSGNK